VLDNTVFKGWVSNAQFISPDELEAQIGLVTTGTTSLNRDAGWLHYNKTDGTDIYIYRKCCRANILWSTVENAQKDKEITIGGEVYVPGWISSLKPRTAFGEANAGGEWNELIYPIYTGDGRAEKFPTAPQWAMYTVTDLGLGPTRMESSPGAQTLCLEGDASNQHATRGYSSAGNANVVGCWFQYAAETANHYGWRPVLRRKSTIPEAPVTPFRGEIAQSNLITFADLQTAVGATIGTQNGSPPWMMIVENGKTYYFPKVPLSISMTREQLNAAGVVDGSKLITFGGKQYKVRLMTGRDTAVSSTAGGEWIRWMTNLTDGTWASYSSADLGGPYPMNGGMTHVWDKHGDGNWALCGYPGMMGAWYQIVAAGADPAYGWRPVLELIDVPPAYVDTWENQGTMPMQRSRWAGAEIDGLVYLHGGYNESTVQQGTLHVFDPVAKTFTAKASTSARSFHDAVVIGGKMYVFGGLDGGSLYLNSVQVYDPVANTWSTLTQTGGTLTARARHKMVKDGTGFLIIGGLTTGGTAVTAIQRIDTITGAVTTVSGSVAGSIYGLAENGYGKIYYSGGYVGAASAAMTELTLATGASLARAPMSSARYSHSSFYAKLGVYLIGGNTATPADATKVVRYRPETNLYETLGTIPYTVGENPATVKVGESFYIFGGNGAAGAQAWKYNP
jgi:hypothetical protein